MMPLPFLFTARDALILWVRFVVMPFEIAFDAVEAEIARQTPTEKEPA